MSGGEHILMIRKDPDLAVAEKLRQGRAEYDDQDIREWIAVHRKH